jgi:hypothetical protein
LGSASSKESLAESEPGPFREIETFDSTNTARS